MELCPTNLWGVNSAISTFFVWLSTNLFVFERQSHIWMSISHLNVKLTFEHQTHILRSILHLNVKLTFERQTHLLRSISHLTVKHIWTSNSYLYVKTSQEADSRCILEFWGLKDIFKSMYFPPIHHPRLHMTPCMVLMHHSLQKGICDWFYTIFLIHNVR